MKDNKIYCDHCGKELDTMHDFDDTQIDMAHKWATAKGKGVCFKKKCVYREWIGGTIYFCPFPKCPFEKTEKQGEKKGERTK